MTILSRFMFANAASCLLFAGVFMTMTNPVSAFLGSFPPQAVVALAAGLAINGIHICYAARRMVALRAEVVWFSLGDLVWWLATTILVSTGIWITSPQGQVGAMVVAMAAAALGVMQLASFSAIRQGLTASDQLKRIGRSWLALPLWVKLWLLVLNAVFLAAPFVLAWSEAKVVLLAYAASGPLLFAFAVWDTGLTRRMGLAHLLPWVPLLWWLVTKLSASSQWTADTSYLLLLAVAVLICLALDIYDLGRWVRGDRGVIGQNSDGGLSGLQSRVTAS